MPVSKSDSAETPEGMRARKQRQNRKRIAEIGVRLFLENGFDATTVEAIAQVADISRRTFFLYFESKEAILDALETEAEDAFRAALSGTPSDAKPLSAVEEALATMISNYETDEAIALDRLMRSTAGLRARKQANYQRQEHALFSALIDKWPTPKRRPSLRLVAMLGIGAVRLAAEQWSEEDGRRPLNDYLKKVFSGLRAEITN
jgi:AcrR family transcriptional regulator